MDSAVDREACVTALEKIKKYLLFLFPGCSCSGRGQQFSPLESSLQYLMRISVSDPMSMALKMRERKRVEKKSRVQTLPRSAFSSLAVLGMPWMARDCSRIIAASAEDLSCLRKHLISFSWSAS